LEVLDSYKGKLRKAIGDQARIRRVPELEFFLDPAITASSRIDEILAEIEATEKSKNNGFEDK
jgi:ribosome-binding factor A